jgi:hypothetical protein
MNEPIYKEEEWKEIKGYEGLYEISNYGRIHKLNTGHLTFGTVNSQNKRKRGHFYKVYKLFKDKKPKEFLVHRLVAEHFIPNPENKSQVHHINEGQQDNFYLNLQWVTPKEHYYISLENNQTNFAGTGKRSLAFKGYKGRFTKEGELVKIYEGRYEIQNDGFCKTGAYEVINRKQKVHRGFVFRRFKNNIQPELGKVYNLESDIFTKKKV